MSTQFGSSVHELVSAIVPTFNRAYCVTRAIDSVLAQSYGNVEVLVVDDGSTDATAQVIRERYGSEPRVQYFHQENRGTAEARNVGLCHARGEYLALLDSDDCWHPWKLEAQIAALRHFPDVGMVWTEFEAVDPAGRIIDPRHMKTMFSGYQHYSDDELFSSRYPMKSLAPHVGEPVEQATFYVGDVFSQMLVGALVLTSTAILRRERFEKVGLFDSRMRIGEDFDFLLRTAREGAVGYIDAPALQYQRGLADHLSREENKLDHALCHLHTIQPFLKNDRARIQLSDGQIRQMLADVHRWIGEKAVKSGHIGLARAHLGKSLWFNQRQLRCLGLFLMSCLPSFVGKIMRNTYRACRAAVR